MGPTWKDSAEGTVSSCILACTLLPPGSVSSTSRLSSDVDATPSGDFGGDFGGGMLSS